MQRQDRQIWRSTFKLKIAARENIDMCADEVREYFSDSVLWFGL